MGLFGILCNKMYVRWKILLGLGTGLWILLCAYDSYLADPVTKFYSDSDEFEWLSQIAEEEILPESPLGRQDEIKFTDDAYGFGTHLIIWNTVTFLVAFATCAIGKIALARLWKLRSLYRHVDIPDNIELICSRGCSASKIPVLLPLKSVTTNTSSESIEKETQLDDLNLSFIHTDKDNRLENRANFLSGSSTSIELTVKPSKSDMSSRHEQQMEKQCAKLRDEMIVIQASSLKEHAVLSRKLEVITREKRDMCRQLVLAQKENRGAKLQLEELLSEKAMLIKRLECASKEFKLNTKSKKQALAKLEESQEIIASIKDELEKAIKERDMLKSKLQMIELEQKLLHERLSKYEPGTVEIKSDKDMFCVSRESGKNVPHTNSVTINTSKEFKKTDISEIAQSQKDVQRVQMRLLNLEKSLDKLKLCGWNSKEMNIRTECITSDTQTEQDTGVLLTTTDSNQEFNTSTFISTQSENPLEAQELASIDPFSKNDNLTDEQRRKILAPAESSGDECPVGSKRFNSFMDDLRMDDPFERAGNILKLLKNSTPRGGDKLDLIGSDDLPVNEVITSQEEDNDAWELPKSRFVSNSAAFKKFLKNMDHLDQNHRKFTIF